MIAIKSAKEVAAKWKRVTPGRSADFEAGVKAPKADWAENTISSQENYNEGIRKAIANNQFAKGVKDAGTEKWKNKTTTIGVQRWGIGVNMAAADYEKGFAPYADTISKLTLSPRFAKGDPRNFERVAEVGQALHKQKVGA